MPKTMHFCSLTCTKNKSVSKVGETPILKTDTMATKRRPPNSVVNKGIYHLGLEQSLHIYIYTSNNNLIIVDTCKSRSTKKWSSSPEVDILLFIPNVYVKAFLIA